MILSTHLRAVAFGPLMAALLLTAAARATHAQVGCELENGDDDDHPVLRSA